MCALTNHNNFSSPNTCNAATQTEKVNVHNPLFLILLKIQRQILMISTICISPIFNNLIFLEINF